MIKKSWITISVIVILGIGSSALASDINGGAIR
jgi:hypothetical protein